MLFPLTLVRFFIVWHKVLVEASPKWYTQLVTGPILSNILINDLDNGAAVKFADDTILADRVEVCATEQQAVEVGW